MKKLILAASLTALAAPLFAQEEQATAPEPGKGDLLNIRADARVDYQRVWGDEGHPERDKSGFEAKFLNFQIDGSIIPGLTYSWRQRIYKKDISNFFDATDWIYLNWNYRDWHFAAGKQVVNIGGWEYDRAPINIYQGSVFWNNIACYELGASVGYSITKNDVLTLQAVQSPFHRKDNHDMYAYNLMWTGRHGCFSSLWSANMLEYERGKYISYISLGNKFDFGKVGIELDLMNRAASHQTYFFKDCSIMGEVAYSPTDRWTVRGKYTYDVNKSGTGADYTVKDGTELNMIGAAVEYFPLKKKRTSLRLHGDFFYSWGHNSNSSDTMQDNTMFCSVGLTWDMNIFSLNRKK